MSSVGVTLQVAGTRSVNGEENEKPAPQLAVVSGTTLSPVTPGVPYAASEKTPDKGAHL